MYETKEICFWASVWAMAFLSSISRSARDADGNGFVRTVGLGASSGFFALGVVGCFCGRFSVDSGWATFALGFAAFVGLMGKQQDKWVKKFFSKLASGFLNKEKP